MNRVLIGREHRHQSFQLGCFDVAQLGHPLLPLLTRTVVDTARRRLRHRGQDRTGVTGEAEADVTVLADRGVILVDLHQGRLFGDTLAIAHAKIEGRADDENDVGVLEGVAAGAVKVMRVALWQHAAAGAVHVSRNIERAHEIDRGSGAT